MISPAPFAAISSGATSGRNHDPLTSTRTTVERATWHPRAAHLIRAVNGDCQRCAADQTFLRMETRPVYESGTKKLRVVDLFAGGGGMTIGAAEAALRLGFGTDVALAVEHDDAVADVYALNFPAARLKRVDVAALFDGTLGSRLTASERTLRRQLGAVDLLVAGPPCQGHSDLNNHTRRDDPRNALYLRAARAAEVLRPTFVVIENVPTVRHDIGKVVDLATSALRAADYTVGSDVLHLVEFGVPQRRRRHILLAVRDELVDPVELLAMHSPCDAHDHRTVRWAIGDLVDRDSSDGPDAAANPTALNRARMQWLIDNNASDLPNQLRPSCHRDKKHTYNAMYGRLSWDYPAPTITTGFGSMGQGRFVHPALARTITPHEAARLQTLPDFFNLDQSKGRGAWATVIGNAVPPLLAVHLIEPLIRALPGRVTGSPNRRNGVPAASSDVIRRRMQNTKRRDTKPELELRSELRRMGLRYRVDYAIKGSRRKSDIVFRRERVIVYVDGCFWHGCPEHGTVPKQNHEWWVEKIATNRRRDADTDAMLTADGWHVLRVWEHDDPGAAAAVVRSVVLARRAALGTALEARRR